MQYAATAHRPPERTLRRDPGRAHRTSATVEEVIDELRVCNRGITSYRQGIDNAEIIDAVHARRAPIPVSTSLRL